MKVYVSLTSIFQNQSRLLKTLHSLLRQTFPLDGIYLYLSRSAYLLDVGFRDHPLTNDLQKVLFDNGRITLAWTENIGPYRKLIPSLQTHWNDDVIIITVDDDTEYHERLVEQMVEDFCREQCVISYRGKTLDQTTWDYDKPLTIRSRCRFNFATGKGGVLYHPRFFHATGDLIFNRELAVAHCETNDDIWFNLLRMAGGIDCFLAEKQYLAQDNTNHQFGLYFQINGLNRRNSRSIASLATKLAQLGWHLGGHPKQHFLK